MNHAATSKLLAVLAALVVVLAVAAGASAARSVPSSIAALGASANTGFATAGAFDEAPANSWVTGTNRAVRSIYMHLRELNPAIAGHAYNYAEPGTGMSELADQAAHVPPGTELVTIATGVNDACESRTTPAAFRAQFEHALRVVEARSPKAPAVVLRSKAAALTRSELALGALRAEDRQVVVDVEEGPPLLGRVLVLARLPAALGAGQWLSGPYRTRGQG